MIQFYRRVFVLSIVFGFFFQYLHAQDSTQFSAPYKLAIKFSPTALLDYTPSFQLALEYQTEVDQAVHLELGYLFDLFSATDDGFNGIKIRAEYRFYRHKLSKKGKRRYWGLHFLHKRLNTPGEVLVDRNNGNFSQFVDARISNVTNSFYYTCGRQYEINDKFRLETVLGFGARRLDVNYKDLPEDAEPRRSRDFLFGNLSDFTFDREGTYITPAVLGTIKLVYVIK